MASLPVCSAILLAVALATASGQDLPKRTGPTEIDPEPKLILTDVPGSSLPDLSLTGTPTSAEQPLPPMDVRKLEMAVENAKKNAALRERLSKAGVVSKLEAEQAAMRVVRLTRDLANARLAAAKNDVEEKRQKAATDETAKGALADAETRLATATSAVQDAATKWDEAVRAAAELRVQRERKLVAVGVEPKLALKQAEAALEKLKAPVAP